MSAQNMMLWLQRFWKSRKRQRRGGKRSPSAKKHVTQELPMPALESWMIILPLCTALGCFLGSLTFRHFSLGSSAILFAGMALVAAVAELAPTIRELGLALFIYAVGAETGGSFLTTLARRGPKLAAACIATVFTGFITALLCGLCFDLPPASVAGLFGGALTSTPALAAAMDGLDADGTALLTTAYGLAYPAGIIGVVLFAQIAGKLEGIDVGAEEAALAAGSPPKIPEDGKKKENKIAVTAPTSHPLPVLMVIGTGYTLGQFPLPLPGESVVTLGSAGGVLLCSILAARAGHAGRIPLLPAPELRLFLRNFGLYAFLAGVGVQTGYLLDLETLHSGVFVLASSLITVSLPMLVCWLLCRRVFGIDVLTMLGTVTGSMTSTPGLAAATAFSPHKIVVQSYVTVYPLALLSMIIMIKLFHFFSSSV